MPRSTTVLLPPHLSKPDPALAEALREYLVANPDLLEDALDLDVYYIDSRAEYMDHEVQGVEVDEGGSVQIDYAVFFHIYFGCDDMNQDDDEDRQITGEWLEGRLVFETPDPPPERYPSEEL